MSASSRQGSKLALRDGAPQAVSQAGQSEMECGLGFGEAAQAASVGGYSQDWLPHCCKIIAMVRLIPILLTILIAAAAADLPTRKYLNLAAIKTMAAAAEAEAQRRSVQVTICIVDDGGNILFLQKADGAGLNTIQIAQRKARYAALYG